LWSSSSWHSHQNPICISSLPMHAICPAHLILLDLIYLSCLEKSASYEAPHWSVFSNLLSFHPSSVQIFSCSQITFNLCSSPTFLLAFNDSKASTSVIPESYIVI
jgi:hypothetical protein